MSGQTHVETFLQALRESVGDGSFVKLTLGKYRGAEKGLKNVYVKPVDLRGAPHLSLLYRHETRDVVKNHTIEEAFEVVGRLLGASFLGGHLFTTARDLRIEFNRKREPRLVEGGPTLTEATARGHERRKRRLVESEGSVWLRGLGVTNERGEVRAAMGDKFRQINKFVETVAGLFNESRLRERKELAVVDMGAGKGYLTFAVYEYFRRLGVEAKVLGLEARRELVELCNRVATEAGFEGLRFRAGRIEEFELESADILIALHACDTATDEAIHKGVAAGAQIIITAPCCHKELRPQIEPPKVLAPALRHGILREREAEMLTDTLRALLLEESGYRTKVFEFVSTEHTRKNTMIAAVRREGGQDRETTRQQIDELKDFYGVREQRLESLLRGEGEGARGRE
ncbi:MAG TPA: SAM-dependent methyltransferase [Pyrinomonadaceae bacterium]|nr:SAM-dependent methyltransferase [Pyrinomonadaceae bacterium]